MISNTLVINALSILGVGALAFFAFFSLKEEVPCCSEYGEGTEDVQINDVECIGTETSITSCPLSTDVNESSSHEHDVGVRCQQGEL